MKHSLNLFFTLTLASQLSAQPNQPVPKAKLIQLTGNFEKASLSKDIRILWPYGPDYRTNSFLEKLNHFGSDLIIA